MTPEQPSPARPEGQPARTPRGLTNRAIGGMFWTFSGTGVQVVVQLLAIMALGRLLTELARRARPLPAPASSWSRLRSSRARPKGPPMT